MTPSGLTESATLKPHNPFGLGNAPSEARLPGEEALTTGSDPHDCRDQGGIYNVVDGLWFGELFGQVSLERAHFGSQSPNAPIELVLAEEVWELWTQICPRGPPEVSLATPTGPLRQHGEGGNLALRR